MLKVQISLLYNQIQYVSFRGKVSTNYGGHLLLSEFNEIA